MDKDTRTQIQRATQAARSLLEQEYAAQLEGTFDILPDGTIADAPGSHLDAEQQLIRQKLVAAIHHHRPHVATHAEAVAAYLREAEFTTLNRFVALKMLEARDLVQQCISQGDQSSGFKEFSGLAAGLVQLPDKGYRLYIECLFDEIAREVQVLFDRRDPASLLWPRRQALNDLLDILNSAELAGVWGEDETIGWVYQYFNSDEERKQMRAESQAPRNSRELAVRNQFFTPRYVVEFLTDNTLGRIWYEMRQGDTRLVEECEYLVRRPSEVFLGEGVEVPEEEATDEDLSQEELLKKTVYIPYRAKKDPRDLKVLDPACGSGHFLLYTFDLLLTIYEEGWADEAATVSETTGKTLRQEYSTLDELRAAVPGLILRNNLNGIDIDPRAAQIASLALWMRAQRAYNDLGIARGQRQPIRKTNVVVAEPMPGDADQLEEFAASLDKQLGQLIRKVFKKMELAGEAGSLLKIEEEIQSAIREIYPEFGGIYQTEDEQRWVAAEGALLEALKEYAEQAQNGKAYQRRLFAEDTARGFAFIDLCRQRYDVVLMNPPFGLGLRHNYEWLKNNYPDAYVDIYASFAARGRDFCRGSLGAITSRSFLTTKKLERFRKKTIVSSIHILMDLGLSVMDSALVESCCFVLESRAGQIANTFIAYDRKPFISQDDQLIEAIHWHFNKYTYQVDRRKVLCLPNSKILYNLPAKLFSILTHSKKAGESLFIAKQGMKSFNDFRFLRLRHEVDSQLIGKDIYWEPLSKGGPYAIFYSDLPLLINWFQDGREVAEENRRANGQVAQARQASTYYRTPGGTYSRRSSKDFGVRVLPEGFIIGEKGPAVLCLDNSSNEFNIGFLNSRFINTLVHLQANANQYDTGILESLPSITFATKARAKVEAATISAIEALRRVSALDETHSIFSCVPIEESLSEMISSWNKIISETEQVVSDSLDIINSVVDEEFGVDSKAFKTTLEKSETHEDTQVDVEEENDFLVFDANEVVFRLLSYAIGCVFGRWNIYLALDRNRIPLLPSSFAPLPSSPPAALNNPECEVSDYDYPLEKNSSGILVDDKGFLDDITYNIRRFFNVVWDSRGDEIEKEVSSEINKVSISDYFRNTFFAQHLRFYSKSRRSAPIYWQLATPTSSFSVWIYYHNCSKDTFYKILNDYVKPKLDHEDRKLAGLTQDAGPDSSSSQRKEIAAQEAFVSELRAFRDEIALIAPLWNPNLNDGVLINFAPLWRLAPHHRSWQKECKDCWDKLVKGEYDWAHLAMHLWPERVIPKCTKDRSLAIAHGLEEVFWEEDDATGKWKPRKVPKEAIAQLIQERSSPAVKDALKRLLEAPVPSSGTQRRSRRNQS